MKRSISLAFSLCVCLFGDANAATDAQKAAAVATYDQLLAHVAPDQTTITLGDMTVPVETVRLWRDQLAGKAPRSASQTGVNKWTAGKVYYLFDASVASATHRAHFRDAGADWATFANLEFIEVTNPTAQPNFIRVNDGGPGLFGGNSAVGMIGGEQQLNIGSTSWNRPTLVHEIGHALGLIHEHQRSDRDSFVDIIEANIPGGASNPNFTLIPGSINNGPYDYRSVMHYARDALTSNGQDTIQALDAAFMDVIGRSLLDRVLSRGDRNGIAAMYGAGPALSLTVTNTNDAGPGSLRAALYRSFDLATDSPAANPVISFQILPTYLSGGVYTIQPTDRLLAPGRGTTIDGTTQTAISDTNVNGPEVVLNGTSILSPETYGIGLQLGEANCVVKGLVINGFSTYGVVIAGTAATGNVISGCYIGTNPAGTAAVANAFAGVEITGGASANRIGGSTAGARNVISGNSARGVYIIGAGTGNMVEGNYLGTNAAGTGPLGNGFSGIEVDNSINTRIGGTVAGARNVISGNAAQGVLLRSAGTTGSLVQGNYLGTDTAGSAAIGNGFAGVEIGGGATNNRIGGAAIAARNVISGNSSQGVAIQGPGTNGNFVEGNFLGTKANGTEALGNGFSGVEIFGGAKSNTIGGAAAGAGNLASGNIFQGLVISGVGSDNNLVTGNLVGTTASGAAALPNGGCGIGIFGGAKWNTIGGTTAAARNVLSGNSNQGVAIANAGTTGNVVAGNFIGVNAAGTGAIPNAFPGVEIFGAAASNTIGGSTPGAGNIISGNLTRGVTISGLGTNSNVFAGNLIGLNATGTAALPNSGPGIQIFGKAQANTIGGINGGRNYISGNLSAGLTISESDTNGNFVQGNTFGRSPSGTTVANGSSAIVLFGGPKLNQIGGSAPGAANLIAGNNGAGVEMYDAATTGNAVAGNSIFGNANLAINLSGGSQNGALVTANDAGDADPGPNNLQNYPVLTAATLELGTTVQGTLNSTAGASFRIEFFASQTADPSGFGEAQNFVGAINVTTNGSGTATFNTILPAIVPTGQVLAATATDGGGNTSELSAAINVGTSGDTDGDGMPNSYESANGLLVNSNDANLDPDADGMTNAAEYRAGTDPNDFESVFRLSGAISSGNVLLTLPASLGRTLRVEYTDDLAVPNSWRFLADQIAGTGSALTITDPGAAALPKRFYRASFLP